MTVNIQKIIQLESSGKPNAVSGKGAIGLCQIMPCVLKDFNKDLSEERCIHPEHLYDPVFNKIVGDWYINKRIPELLKSYNIPDCEVFRLVAYNSGISRLNDWWLKLNEESRNYLRKYFELNNK